MNRTSNQNVLVTTTPDLEGWKITEYLDAVSAHVVAGTNIFSDIAASWRDVFGGQSKSYKKQLEQINKKVVDELREEAVQRGANALVGLQIDHDQISGQSKEMFMVTASATAVYAKSGSESGVIEKQEVGPITAREVGIEERTVRLVTRANEGALQLSEENWRFLIENQVSDVAGAIQAELIEVLGVPVLSERQKQHLSSGRNYFLSISEEKAKDHLYKMVSHDEDEVANWAVGVLADGNLLDLGRIESMLGGDFYDEKKPALEILTRVDKPYYEPNDIERLNALKMIIERGFEQRGEVFEVEDSGMFSSDTKEVWQIKEGEHNPMSQEYCSETGLDIYGFGETETRPDKAVRVLETKIAALNRRFGGASNGDNG